VATSISSYEVIARFCICGCRILVSPSNTKVVVDPDCDLAPACEAEHDGIFEWSWLSEPRGTPPPCVTRALLRHWMCTKEPPP
jgi:hypothetical protein